MGQRWLDGYSAQVELYFLVDGKRHEIAQIGNGSFILRDPNEIPPGTSGTLVIKIDGREEREEVMLCNGAAKREEPVLFF